MYAFAWCYHAAFEPGKALPFASLSLKIVLKCVQRHGRRPRVAIRPQGQIDPKYKAVFGDVANQVVDGLDLTGKILVVGNLAAAISATGGLAVLVVDINQVNIAGDIQFTRSELAHAYDPQLGTLCRCAAAFRALRCTMRGIQGFLGFEHRHIKRQLGQFGHGPGYHGQCGLASGLGITIEHCQTLHHQLPQHPQGSADCHAFSEQGLQGLFHVRAYRCTVRQQAQLAGVAAAYALHKTRIARRGGGRRDARSRRVRN